MELAVYYREKVESRFMHRTPLVAISVICLFTGQASRSQSVATATYDVYTLSYGVYPGFPASRFPACLQTPIKSEKSISR
jgi:hypothetical protein